MKRFDRGNMVASFVFLCVSAYALIDGQETAMWACLIISVIYRKVDEINKKIEVK